MSPAPDADAVVRQDLRACHTARREIDGCPLLVKDLRDLDHPVGPKRVVILTREEGLCGKSKGCVKPRTIHGGHALLVPENLLERRY